MFLQMKQKREMRNPFEGVPIPVVAYFTGVCLCAMGILFSLLGWDLQKLFPSVSDWRPFWWVMTPVSVILALIGIAVIFFTRRVERLKRTSYHDIGK